MISNLILHLQYQITINRRQRISGVIKMKTLYCKNSELLEILENNGIEMICNENMQIEISDEDAEKIDSIVNELAPAASGDYAIEDIE